MTLRPLDAALRDVAARTEVHEVRAGGEQDHARVRGVADVRVGTGGDELVVFVDDDFKGEEGAKDLV